MDHAAPTRRIYLASASPRRRELLAQIGFGCEVLRVEVDETPGPGEAPGDLACRLALAKARAGAAVAADPSRPVLAADTVVALGTEIFGKPVDQADGVRILGRLSGRTHEVYTAVAVVADGLERVQLSRTEVDFRPLEAAEILAYWQSGEPADKAGAYAIQGLGALFISGIRGSYSGVMGLPLFETAQLLARFGLPVLPLAAADGDDRAATKSGGRP
jgi:septum formation protein